MDGGDTTEEEEGIAGYIQAPPELLPDLNFLPEPVEIEDDEFKHEDGYFSQEEQVVEGDKGGHPDIEYCSEEDSLLVQRARKRIKKY